MKKNYKYSKIIDELQGHLAEYGEDFKIQVLKRKRKVKSPIQDSEITEIYVDLLEDYVLDKNEILEEEKEQYIIEEMSIAQALGEFMAQDILF